MPKKRALPMLQFHLLLTKEERKMLSEMATKEGRTAAAMVRQLIRRGAVAS